jgi:two-component system sensor kinase FixL
MSALSAYSESAMMLLSEKEDNFDRRQRVRDILKKVVSETLRASEIVRGLRSYFIGGASNLQNTSAIKMIDDCIESLIIKNDVKVEKVYTHQNDTVIVDFVQMRTAIGNLLKNAMEASPLGMLVSIKVFDVDAHSVCIQVIDQGEPLSEELVDQVFRPFYTQKKDGLGLGLSISKLLVENNGGLLRYVGNPVKRFEIVLPSEKTPS